MDRQLAIEIIRCLPRGRSLYAYGKDAYALQLLQYYVGEGKSVSAIRQSRYARLLNKAPVRKLLAGCGNSRLGSDDIDVFQLENQESFSLSLDLWDGSDGCGQTSRRGWNLVLQLNFSNRHNSRYRALVKPLEKQLFNYGGHPVYRDRRRHYFRETLAWARLDVDFDNDECLVEEIQSDWVREVNCLLDEARRARKRERNIRDDCYWPVQGRLDDIIDYCSWFNHNYARLWAEAMLSATLHLVKRELGLRRVYYHSDRWGAQVKNMGWSRPPRSLYSKLPKAFCFTETSAAPKLLRDDIRYRRLRRKVKDIHWMELAW